MRVLQPRLIFALVLLAGGLGPQQARADAAALWGTFTQKYTTYLARDSQMLLPLPELSKEAWGRLKQTVTLELLHKEPNRFYNSKAYDFTLYRAKESGAYFIDAKGGFWGMDELIYGPLTEGQLGQ